MMHFYKDSKTKPPAITALVCLVLLAAAIVWFMAMPAGESKNKSELYALETIVRKVDRESDIVTCEDSNGNLWEFYGCEDWQEGDCASLLMNDQGTPTICDDVIRGATCARWTLPH